LASWLVLALLPLELGLELAKLGALNVFMFKAESPAVDETPWEPMVRRLIVA